jgi:hypothetical protein
MRTNAVLRPELSLLAEEYDKNALQEGFIGAKVMPYFKTPVNTGVYPVMPLETFYKINDTRRAPRTRANSDDFDFKLSTFVTEEHAWEAKVDDSEKAIFSNYIQGDSVATLRCIDKLMRGREKTIADFVMNEENAGGVFQPTKKWTAADSTFIVDVSDAIETMRKTRAINPNTMVMSEKIYRTLIKHPILMDYFAKAGNAHLLNSKVESEALLAKLFSIENLYVPNALYDSTGEGEESELTDLWSSNYVSLLRVESGNDLSRPQFGRTFVYSKRSGTPPDYIVTESYRDESHQSDVIRTRYYMQSNVISKAANFLIKNVL